MADLYRATKKLAIATFREDGFKPDPLGEGLYKKVDNDTSVIIQIAGMWSHVEAYAGLRFDSINKKLREAAIKSDWPESKSEMFKLKLFGLFREKVGEYCASSEDLGVYCPKDAIISDASGIVQEVSAKNVEYGKIKELSQALAYARENDLILPFGIYALPAGARATSDAQLWDWCIEHVTPHVPLPEYAAYERLLYELKNA